MRLLEGQTALVTGSSRGIGRAIALKLADAGAEILLHYHQNEAAAQSVGREISGQSRLLKADLGLPKNIDAMFESRSEEHTSELQSQSNLVCRLLLEKKKNK